MLSQEPEAQVTLDVGEGPQSPGSLQGDLTPFRRSPESWYYRRVIETLDGLPSRPLRPLTRDFEFKWKEWFLSWKKKEQGAETDWAPGVMGRGCGCRWKPGEVCGLHQSFNRCRRPPWARHSA